MTTYYHIPGHHIVHSRLGCQRFSAAFKRGDFLTHKKRPWYCTICDHCQALDARDKRMAKQLRPMKKRDKG